MAPLTTRGDRSPAATARASRMLLQAARYRACEPPTSQLQSQAHTWQGLYLASTSHVTVSYRVCPF